MQHLDLGFTDTCENVCDTYFQSYFPRAFNVSKALRERGGEEQVCVVAMHTMCDTEREIACVQACVIAFHKMCKMERELER